MSQSHRTPGWLLQSRRREWSRAACEQHAEHARAHGICGALEDAGDQMSGGEAQQQKQAREHDHDDDRELRSITKADREMSIVGVSSSPASSSTEP
ncbi:hypothetical protein IVB15_24970 [Bradyrhizobium sp. 182]|nr:hypothetical protein [Bradyrhizobium sp. 182]